MTIDGVMQSPGAPQEDPGNGFDLGGWLPPLFDEETGEYMNGVFDAAGAFLLGRKTYEAMAGYWPNVTDPAIRVGTALNTLPKHVATTTLDELTWNNSGARHRRHRPGGYHAQGAPGPRTADPRQRRLARYLMGHGLIDACRLIVFPVVLGRGARLFADGAPPTAMRLTDSRTTASGIAMHTYETAGQPSFGSVV